MPLSSNQQVLLSLCASDWIADPLNSPLPEAYPELHWLWQALANHPSLNGVLADQLAAAEQREAELLERLASANAMLAEVKLDPQ